MFRRKRSKKAIPKSDASVLFIFIAAVGTLILASTVISLSSTRRISIEDSSTSFLNRAEQALPANAVGPMSYIQIESAIKPTLVFFYWLAEQPRLSLVQWDTRIGRFVLRYSHLLHGQFNQTEAAQLKQIQSGWGGEAMIELRSVFTTATETATVAYFQLKEQRLKQLAFRGPAGMFNQDYFLVGEIPAGRSELAFEDLDGDDVTEVRLIITDEKGDRIISVFKWSGEELIYNENWSVALTARENLFPEPAVSVTE